MPVNPVRVAVTTTGWLGVGWFGVATTSLIRGARPLWATELAVPAVFFFVAVEAAQLSESL